MDMDTARMVRLVSRLSIGIIAVLGNSLTLVAFKTNRRLHTPSNYLVASLAAADLLVGLVKIIIPTIDYYTDICIKTYDICRKFLIHVSFMVVGFHIMLIACDRFIAIVYPLRYMALMNMSTIKKMVGGVWATSLLFCGSLFFWLLVGAPPLACSRGTDKIPYEQLYFFSTLVYFTNVLIIMVVYGKISLIAHRHRTQMMQSDGIPPEEVTQLTKRRRATRLITSIIVAYVVAWTPHIVIILIVAVKDQSLANLKH